MKKMIYSNLTLTKYTYEIDVDIIPRKNDDYT